MCTAATYKTKDFYFGRTLDYEFSYGDEITITPRNFPFKFRHINECNSHFAMIGMAHIADGYPLYYDAMNEKGLCMAGLNFVGNAVYFEPKNGKENIAQFEFIPYILSHCDSVLQARKKLENLNITNTQFSNKLPCAQLHWIISDRNESLTVESTNDGLKIYDNPVGVLTNNPPFDIQMFMLNNYMSLSPKQPESVNQFFHILGSVDQQRGCCEVSDGKYEITLYTSCCNADKGIYYYTTYNNHQICAVDMHKTDLDMVELTAYTPITEGKVLFQN